MNRSVPLRAGAFLEEAVGGRGGPGSSAEGRGERSPEAKRTGALGR
jgi:hypothetical protein